MADRNPNIRKIQKLIDSRKVAEDGARLTLLENTLKIMTEETSDRDASLAKHLALNLEKEKQHAALEQSVAQLSEKWTHTQAMTAEYSSLVEEMRCLSEVYDTYSAMEASAMKMAEQSEAEFQDEDDELKALNEENEKLQRGLEAVQNENKQRIEDHKDTVNKIKEEIEESKKITASLEVSIQVTQEKLNKQKHEFEAKQNRKLALQNENMELKENLTKRQKEIDEEKKAYAAKEKLLKEEDCKMEDKLKEMKILVEKRGIFNINQTDTLNTLRAEKEELEKDVNQGITVTQTEVDEQVKKLEEQKQILCQLKIQAESTTITQETIDELNNKLEYTKDKITAKQSEFEQIKSESMLKKTELETLLAQSESFKKTSEETRQSNAAKLDDAKKKLQTTKSDYAKTKTAYKSVHIECTVVKRSLHDLQLQMDKIRKSVKVAKPTQVAVAPVVAVEAGTSGTPGSNITIKRAKPGDINSSQETEASSVKSYNGVKLERFQRTLFKMPSDKSVVKK